MPPVSPVLPDPSAPVSGAVTSALPATSAPAGGAVTSALPGSGPPAAGTVTSVTPASGVSASGTVTPVMSPTSVAPGGAVASVPPGPAAVPPPAPSDAVRHSPQTLSDEQKEQVVENIESYNLRIEGVEGDFAANGIYQMKVWENNPYSDERVWPQTNGYALRRQNMTGAWSVTNPGAMTVAVGIPATTPWIFDPWDERVVWADPSAPEPEVYAFAAGNLVMDADVFLAYLSANAAAARYSMGVPRTQDAMLLSGNQTAAGAKTFAGQVEGTGQMAATEKSVMTRELTAVESMMNVGSIKLLGPFTAIGTGASMTVAGDDIALFVAANANATARIVLARNLTSQSVWGGATIDCTRNFDLAFSLAAYIAQAGSKVRLSYGASGAAPNADADPIAGKGWGIEFTRLTDASFRIRLFAYDAGLVWSAGTYDVTGYANKSFLFRKQAGTLSLWVVALTSRINTTAAPTLTMAGAPTTGATSNATVALEICNGATSSVGSALRLLSQPISRVW